MWHGSMAEACYFLSEGSGAIRNHSDSMGCALPVAKTPSCLTSCKPKNSKGLSPSLKCAGVCGSDPPLRTKGRASAEGSKRWWLRKGGWSPPAPALLVGCRAMRRRFGSVGYGVGTAAPGCTGGLYQQPVAPRASPLLLCNTADPGVAGTSASGMGQKRKGPPWGTQAPPQKIGSSDRHRFMFLNASSCAFMT